MRRPSAFYPYKTVLRGAVISLAVIGLTAGALATAGAAVASARAPARSTADVRFVQITTRSNQNGDSTYINNPATNGHRHVLIFVTPNWNPNNTSGGRYNNHAIGVWYDTSVNKWAIFNEDGAAMRLGRAFNVLVVPRASRTAFQVTSSSANTSGDSLFMNHGLLNGNTHILLQVTQIWNRTGSVGVYNDHNIGVWFSGPEWAIFQQDTGSMTIGASFNVLVGTAGTGGTATLLKAKASNTTLNWTLLNNRLTNNKSRAMVFATPNWNPGNVGGTYDDSPIGVWYDKHVNPHMWSVFNQNTSLNMPIHAAFNLLIFGTR